MNETLRKYIDYGIYNNNLYFPYNKASISSYIKKLTNITEIIKHSDTTEIIQYAINNCDNIFINAYLIYASQIYNEKYLEYIISLIENKWDLYIVLYFVLEMHNKTIKNRILTYFLNQKSFVSNLSEKFLIKHNVMCKTKFSKQRRKQILTIKEKFYDGTFKECDIENLKNLNVHPDELDYYLSYTLAPLVKEKIFSFYLDNENFQDMVFLIDKSYIQNIPDILLDIIEEKLLNISDIEQIIYLFIYKDKINNVSLRKLIENALSNLTLNHFKTEVIKDIRIYINPKYNIYIDKEDKINYLHYLATYVSILSSIYDLPIYVNDVKIENTGLIETISQIKNAEISMSYKNINCPILDNSLVFSNIEISAFARWNILDKNAEDYSENLVISGYNTKNFMEVLSLLG